VYGPKISKISTWPISKFLGAFIQLTIQHQCFKFDVIHFTGYGVIAEKPRVRQLGQIFPCTLYEKLCVGSNNESHFLMASMTMQSLGKIVQPAPLTTVGGINVTLICSRAGAFDVLVGGRADRDVFDKKKDIKPQNNNSLNTQHWLVARKEK